MIKLQSLFAILLMTLVSISCAKHKTVKPGESEAYGNAIIEVSGGKQAAPVGSALDQPVVVQVNDDKGTAVPNAAVHFSGPAGVMFNPSSAQTDSSGQASTTVSLGSSPGRYRIEPWIQDRSGKRVGLPLDEIALGYEQVLGRELAVRYCNRCHDQESTAERVSNYDNLKTKPHALSDGDTLNKMTDDELVSIIAHGGPALNRSAEMPAYGYTLGKSEIQAVLSFMRAVSDPPYQSKGVVYAQK
jgi:mono/diheme cytochrome c family protein